MQSYLSVTVLPVFRFRERTLWKPQDHPLCHLNAVSERAGQHLQPGAAVAGLPPRTRQQLLVRLRDPRALCVQRKLVARASPAAAAAASRPAARRTCIDPRQLIRPP